MGMLAGSGTVGSVVGRLGRHSATTMAVILIKSAKLNHKTGQVEQQSDFLTAAPETLPLEELRELSAA